MHIIFCYLNSFLYPSHHHTHYLAALYQCPPSPLCPFVKFYPCVCLTESNIRCRECNQTTLERTFNRREGKVFLSFYCTSHCDNKHAFDTKAQTCTVWARCRGTFPCWSLLHSHESGGLMLILGSFSYLLCEKMISSHETSAGCLVDKTRLCITSVLQSWLPELSDRWSARVRLTTAHCDPGQLLWHVLSHGILQMFQQAESSLTFSFCSRLLLWFNLSPPCLFSCVCLPLLSGCTDHFR